MASSVFGDAGLSAVFPYVFSVVAAFIVLVFVFVIVSRVRAAKKVRDAGHDPLTLDSDLAVRAMESKALAPDESVESRLADLEQLLVARTITADEYAEARRRILDSI
ncbi:SHOCT domain-containing protein [Marisediminicola sp. LYQ134]|uniref:SHOCT domain-containing protein n=1 Tax=Marisediminicola sp. LYQ134 TaxID=3391061 RepID=UPI003983C9FB